MPFKYTHTSLEDWPPAVAISGRLDDLLIGSGEVLSNDIYHFIRICSWTPNMPPKYIHNSTDIMAG